jgi:hypothetical protein
MDVLQGQQHEDPASSVATFAAQQEDLTWTFKQLGHGVGLQR